MLINELSSKILKITFSHSDIDIDSHFSNTQYLENAGILTFGDMATRIFEKTLRKREYEPVLLNLCFEDDKSIGLDMPRTWYLNKGKHALAIAHYYNYLNFHGIVENYNLDSFNKKITGNYGHIACIEVYNEVDLLHSLVETGYPFFGTPRTLTECVRYLEGWDLTLYPRLKGYVTFSNYIELWSRLYYPKFNGSEWHLGKTKSARILKKRPTNVRDSVRFFWENYLLQKYPKVSPEDIEIDILSPKFCEKRCPEIILISENLFCHENNSSVRIFENLTTKQGKDSIYLANKKSDIPLKIADLAREQYPDALILLLENDSSMSSNFSLLNPIKHSLNTDIVLSTHVLKHVIENYKLYTGKNFSHLIKVKK